MFRAPFILIVARIPHYVLLLVVLFLFVVICYYGRFGRVSFDVTENKRHSLTRGSLELLEKLERPVTIRYYVNRSQNVMPIGLRNYSERINGFLETVVKQGQGKVILERLDPEPDTDAEQSALLDGMEGQPISPEVPIYMGMSISSAGRRQVIPFLFPENENSLEYDVISKIQEVARKEKTNIGLLSTIPIAQTNETGPWSIIKKLEEIFTVTPLSLGGEISKEVDIVMLIHPRNLTPRTELQLDRFIQRGGKLIILMDSLSLASDFLQFADGMEGMQSRWDGLQRATGVRFDADYTIMDMLFATDMDRGFGVERLGYVLSVNSLGINPDHVITRQLTKLLMPVCGTFQGEVHPGLIVTPLVRSSGQSRLEKSEAILFSDRNRNVQLNTVSLNEGGVYPMVILIEGRIHSFATGKPMSVPDNTKLIIFGDSDLLADPYSVRVQEVQGKHVIHPTNNNMSLLFNCLDFMRDNTLLNNARGRTSRSRPLLQLAQMEQSIQKRHQGRLVELERQLADYNAQERRLREQSAGGVMNEGYRRILQERAQNIQRTQTELRSIRRQLREEKNALISRIKWLNTALIPILSAITGVMVMAFRHHSTRAV